MQMMSLSKCNLCFTRPHEQVGALHGGRVVTIVEQHFCEGYRVNCC
jgi:hypothetical protein